jgi:peptidoglycan/LPS O-acetylase OafA/YrhL
LKNSSITVAELLIDRNNGLTFVRLILSLLVLIGHSYSLGGFNGDHDFFYVMTRGQENAGEMAVKSFMFLSGLLVSASFERQKIGIYFVKRTLRIFPGYLCSILIISFILGPIAALLSNVDLSTYFSTYQNGPWTFVIKNSLLAIRQGGILDLLHKNPFPDYFAGSHWTIWPEFQGYFVVAICGFLGFLKKLRFLLIPFLVFYVLSLVAVFSPGSLSYLNDTRRIYLALYLLVGMIFYSLRHCILINKKGLFLSIFFFSICIFLSTYDFIMPFLLGYVLLTLSYILPDSLKKIDKIGDFSYGIYLYHFPIQQIASLAGVHRFGFIPYLALTFIFTVLFAVISWYCVEKRASRVSFKFVK